MAELMTPEEVSASLDGRISAWTIKALVRKRKVACTRGPHRKVLFTEEQRRAILTHLTDDPAQETTAPGAFKGTARSEAARRGKK
jgi:hypothetical protein